MRRHYRKKAVTASLLIVVLFALSVQNMRQAYGPLQEALQAKPVRLSTLKETIRRLETVVNDHFIKRYAFIEMYGYVQSLQGKHEENNFEVVKDTRGGLHFSYFGTGPNPTEVLADRVRTLGERIPGGHTKLSYVMTPDKYIRGYTELPRGIPYHYNNETADRLLDRLQAAGIDTLDLREGLLDSGIPPEELFFKTDHHWTIQTAFWGYVQMVKHLEEVYGARLDPSGFYTDLRNYNVLTYKASYIGSMGRKTGKYYAGADDFSLIYPKFKTDYVFDFHTNEYGGTLQGRFEEALLSVYSLNVKGNDYGLTADKYFSYLYGNQGVAHIINQERPKGLKVLFIKDSLAVPMAAFLSTVCSEVYLIDPRYYREDIQSFISSTKPDHVFVSISPQNLVEEFFPFGRPSH